MAGTGDVVSSSIIYCEEIFGDKVVFIDAKPNELALEKYIQIIVERLLTAIEPDIAEGEAPILPIIERFRPRVLPLRCFSAQSVQRILR